MTEEEKCRKCGEEVSEEDFFGEYESRGKEHGNEYICYGYKCSNCGHKEEF